MTETYRLKFDVSETTPFFRSCYRAFRRFGMARDDVNMMMIGVAMVTDHAKVEIKPWPAAPKEAPK